MVAILPTLQAPLFRIGRADDPLALPPWEAVGEGRYDDPRDLPKYRVLYCGERTACFYERLANFAPDIRGVVPTPITAGWIARRRIAQFTIDDPNNQLNWLDVGDSETISHLRAEFGEQAASSGLREFDLSVITQHALPLTQSIGRWAFEQGFSGITYPSRHGVNLRCWAIFEPATSAIVRQGIDSISCDDPDLLRVAAAWGLVIH